MAPTIGHRRIPKLLKHEARDLEQRDLAVRRLGETPTQQLRWVVHEFARRDLANARPEELVALGYDLRALTPPLGTHTRSPRAPMDAALLGQIHAAVNAGLRLLVASESTGLDGGWLLPAPTRVRLVRHGGFFLRAQESRSESDSILAAIGELILRAGEGLRACPVCTTPFVKVGKRQFCSEPCAMKRRNAKRPARRKK